MGARRWNGSGPKRLLILKMGPDLRHDFQKLPLNLIHDFGRQIGPVGRIVEREIHAVARHEFLPNEQAATIAFLVKRVRREDALAPDSQHIHVAISHEV